MRRTMWLVAAIACFGVRSAHAQADPDSVKLRNDCRLAAQILATGNPAPHLGWAHALIGFCGRDQWADASASAIRRLRKSTDQDELAAEWRHLWMLRDGSLFFAVSEIASDRAASREARVWALRTLATYIDPHGIYAALTDTISDASGVHPVCITARASGGPALTAARPLPADFEQQARNLASRITDDDADDPVIRRAASCVLAAPVYAVIQSG